MKKIKLFIIAGIYITCTLSAQVWVGGKDGTLLKSENGGNNFVPASLPTMLVGTGKLSVTGIYSGEADTLFFSGQFDNSESYIVKTNDGGVSYFDTIKEGTTEMATYTDLNGDITRFPGSNVFINPSIRSDGRNITRYNTTTKQWVNASHMTRTQLEGVTAINSTTAFAALKEMIGKTTNAGSSWSTAYMPSVLKSIAIFGNGNIIAVGENGLVKLSSDNGRNWITPTGITTTQKLNNIAISPSGNVALIVGDNKLCYRSIDNGLNWTSITISTAQGNLLSVSFADDNAVLVGGVKESITNTDFHRSTDGGATFTEIADGNIDLTGWTGNQGPNIYDIHFADANNGWAVISDNYGGIKGLTIRTTDGGATWKATTYKNVNYSYAIWGIDDKSSFFSADKDIYMTADTGITWNKSTIDIAPTATITDIYFETDLIGYFTAGSAIYKSINGGLNWSRANDNLSNGTYNAVIKIADSVIVAGTKAQILKSTDLSVWQNIGYLNYSVGDFYDISASSSSNIVTVGTLGMVLLSTNGGTTWNFIGNNSQFNYNFKFVKLYNNDSIYAISDDGYTAVSYDAGSTWILDTIDKSSSLILNDFEMAHPGYAIVVGNNGIIYKTNNWTDWTQITSGTSKNLYSVEYKDTTNYFPTPSKELFNDRTESFFYPNPAKDYITLNAMGLINVSVVDMRGNVVLSSNSFTSSNKLNVSSLENGAYIILLKTQEGTIKQILLKE